MVEVEVNCSRDKKLEQVMDRRVGQYCGSGRLQCFVSLCIGGRS